MTSKTHWERIYRTRDVREVSWFQEHAAQSIELIKKTGVSLAAKIIDVGGGASTLVDDLVDQGYSEVTVLDISGTALRRSQERLGQRASLVTWLEWYRPAVHILLLPKTIARLKNACEVQVRASTAH